MNILIIGTEVVSKIIGEAILNEVDSITYVDDSNIAYKNWNFSNPKVKFFRGDINRMDILLEAGLDNADLVIASTSNDATNAFTCASLTSAPVAFTTLVTFSSVTSFCNLCNINAA